MAECPVEVVAGNNDFFADLPKELEFNIDKFIDAIAISIKSLSK